MTRALEFPRSSQLRTFSLISSSFLHNSSHYKTGMVESVKLFRKEQPNRLPAQNVARKKNTLLKKCQYSSEWQKSRSRRQIIRMTWKTRINYFLYRDRAFTFYYEESCLIRANAAGTPGLNAETWVSRSIADHSAATNYLCYRRLFLLPIVRQDVLAEPAVSTQRDADRGSMRYVLDGKRDRVVPRMRARQIRDHWPTLLVYMALINPA